MSFIKKNFCLIQAVMMLCLSVVNIVISANDCRYRPYSYLVYLVAFFLISAVMTIFAAIFRNDATKISANSAVMMPIFAFIFSITLLIVFDGTIDRMENNSIYELILLGITMLTSAIIFFFYNKKDWLKIVGIAISFSALIFYLFVVLVATMIMNFGKSKIISTVTSPVAARVTITVSYDDGALGGSTVQRRYDNFPEAYLALGCIVEKEEAVYIGPWRSEDWR